MATQKALLETSTLADVEDTEPNRLERSDHLSEAEIRDMVEKVIYIIASVTVAI